MFRRLSSFLIGVVINFFFFLSFMKICFNFCRSIREFKRLITFEFGIFILFSEVVNFAVYQVKS